MLHEPFKIILTSAFWFSILLEWIQNRGIRNTIPYTEYVVSANQS
jgi:hypothetical protein